MADTPLFRRLMQPLSRLLVGEQDQAPLPRDDDDDFGDQEIHQTLDDVLRQEAGRYGTKVHVVSLTGIREVVGPDKWRKMAEKVQMICESAIHRHIGKGGVFGRRGEDLFVLVFSRLEPLEATARSQQIAKEIGERLLGSARFSASNLVCFTAVDLSQAMGEDGQLDLGVLGDAVAEVRSAQGAEAEAEAEELRRSLQPSDWQPAEAERRTFASAKPIEAMSDAAVDRVEPQGSYELDLLPTWEAQGEALSSYFCRIRRQDRPQAPLLLGGKAYTGGQGVAFALDQTVAAQAVHLLEGLAAEHLRCALVVPIHFTSLVTRQRMMVTGIYSRLPDGVRKLKLDLEVFGVPAEPTPSQLADVCSALKPLCRDVLLRVPYAKFPAGLAADARFDALGMDIDELDDIAGADPAVLRDLAVLQQHAEGVGLGSYAWNLRSRVTVRGAVRLGIGRVNGVALVKPVAKPKAPVTVPKQRFLDG